MKIKATVNNQELELDIDEQSLVKAGYIKAKKECKRWRAERNGAYFFLTYDGYTTNSHEEYSPTSNSRYNLGNYYQTKELAQAALDRQLALVRVNDRIMELNEGWEPDWDDDNQQKYYVQYKHESVGIVYGSLYTWEIPNRLDYVKSSDVAFQIISECEDDLKVIFGV